MTEKKIDQGDLQKALRTLQDLAKGHASREGLSTKVETMVGESGATQLYHTPADSDPGGWAGTSEKEESWEDHVSTDGTDYQAQGKMAKSILAKLSKGQQLTAAEYDFVSKGGMAFLKKKDDDKEDAEKAMDKKDDKEEVEKAHSDEQEDKKLVRDMVKPDAVKKSMLDHAAENKQVAPGLEVSEFLAGLVTVIHKSLQSMEARITGQVLSAVHKTAEETGSVQKSMAEALAGLGEVLSVQAQRLEQVEAGAARGPKSTMMSKSVNSGEDNIQSLSKSQITNKLVDMVQKGQATTGDVLKYDATGEISPELAARVAGR